ncbi:hypothetical protein [Pseudofrankia sp. BMG5.36]|uniref:hypothetical protein n=1 Tax=Pseudofrankia sp. BMG5.36 TaxID=1834512 RepID=UPI0008D92C4D|nr:hypothetical protein [Pseudofrankia sp. BMG5.36]OHV57959.1 hypothetical protein BCD48_42725 [Pseudofrankia sp. BMG5.36]
MSSTHGKTSAADLGSLTLDDLALRSEKAHADHMATYTATEVLHLVFMSTPEHDQEVVDVIDAAYRLIRQYRKKTYREWRGAYRIWVTEAGFEIPPEMTEATDSESESEV